MKTNLYLSVLVILLIATQVYTQEDCCAVNTISTVGTATVQVTPDIAQIIVTATANANTSASALSKVNSQISSLVSVFKSFNISSANYSTSSISLTQQINYTSTPYRVTGQEASQTLIITVGNLSDLSNFIQKIGNVNITINSLQFYSSNPESGLSIARKAAFTDALDKFNQYLSLTKLKNGGLKKIIDLNSELYSPIQASYIQYDQSLVTLPLGKIQVSASVEAVWATKS